MNGVSRKVLWAVLLCVIGTVSFGASALEHDTQESSAFAVIAHIDPSDLESMKAEKKLPKSVEKILRKQSDLVQCFNGFSDDGHLNKTGMNQFIGVSVPLRGVKDDGLVIVPGSVPCGMGADIDEFWIFVRHGESYFLVLKTFARSVDVLSKKRGGYHLIRIEAGTAVTEWRVIYAFKEPHGYLPERCRQRKWQAAQKESGKLRPGPWEAISCSPSGSKPYR